jgi:hypothetical protein
VRNHAVSRTDAGWVRFVVTKHDLADFQECKTMFLQGGQRLLHLIESGDDRPKESTRLERRADLFNIFVGILNIEEERIDVGFVKTFFDVAQLEKFMLKNDLLP